MAPIDADATPRPLAGTRVLDFGQVLATPMATHLLGMLGAEVIKVEPHDGEWLRQVIPQVSYSTQNADKRSITLDMRAAGAAETVGRLAATVDVFVQGFAPGTAEAMGIGFDAIRARNAHIVYASLSAFGTEGPYAGRPGFDHIVQAMSGIMPATGFPGTPPTKVGAPYLDYGGGLLLAFGILAGLLERDRTNTAVEIDTTMLDAGLLMNAGGLVRAANHGVDPPRTGNDAFSGAATSGAFETADGMLMIAANKPSHVVRLGELLGLRDLVEDPAIGRPGADEAVIATVRAAMAERFATLPAAEWEQRCLAAGVPAGRVRRLTDVVSEGHPAARGLLHTVPDPRDDDPERTAQLPGSPVRINGHLPGPTALARSLGGDTVDVLRTAGFEDAEIDALAVRGVIRPPTGH